MRIAMIAMGAAVGLVAALQVSPAEAGRDTACLPASVKAALAKIEAKFGDVQVISAYRPGARVAGTGRRSKHADCRAVDFNPPAGKYQAVASWLKANFDGGVGTYGCGMHHIHIDNGGRYRWHTCSGGGKRTVAKRPTRKVTYASADTGRVRAATKRRESAPVRTAGPSRQGRPKWVSAAFGASS